MTAMSRGISSLFVAAVFALPVVCSACERSGSSRAPAAEEDQTDRLTRGLLANLRTRDLEAALALSTAALAGDLEQRGAGELAVIGQTLAWLGPVESLEYESEQAVADGVSRQYSVRFGRGSVGLTVTVVGDKLEGFEFDAGQWRALVDRAAEAAAGSLRVAEFRYLDAQGQVLAGTLDPANISYELALEGLDAQLREHHVVIAKSVRDAEGHEVYRQTEDDDIRFPQAEAGSGGGRITGSVGVPGPGRYQLELKIRDLVGDQMMVHKQSFVIE